MIAAIRVGGSVKTIYVWHTSPHPVCRQSATNSKYLSVVTKSQYFGTLCDVQYHMLINTFG